MFNMKVIPMPIIVILFIILHFATALNVNAQCFGYARVYATSETSGGTSPLPIDNKSRAIGSDLEDFSSINIPTSGATRFQRLSFSPQTFTSSQPIHVKLGSEVTGSLGFTLEVQVFNSGTPVGIPTILSSGTFVNLVSGQNVSDIVIPSPGSNFDAVQITVKGGPLALISVGKINIYAAYVNQLITTGVNCETVADVISGTTSGLLGALNGVTNEDDAVDASLSTYATINQTVNVAGVVHLTALFQAPSVTGDSISVVIQDPSAAILDPSVFADLKVVTYLGNTVVETVPANSSLLGIKLIDATNHIYRFTYPSSAPFDRISIQAGGSLTALGKVYIYDIKRMIPKPQLLIDGLSVPSKTICVGANTIITIDPVQTCTSYIWYDALVGGNVVHTGSAYLINKAAGTYNYYIESVREGCSSTASTRSLVTVIVNPKLATPTLAITSN